MYFLPLLMWNLKSFYHYPPFSSFEKGYITFQGSGVEGTGDFFLIWKPLENEVKISWSLERDLEVVRRLRPD